MLAIVTAQWLRETNVSPARIRAYERALIGLDGGGAPRTSGRVADVPVASAGAGPTVVAAPTAPARSGSSAGRGRKRGRR